MSWRRFCQRTYCVNTTSGRQRRPWLPPVPMNSSGKCVCIYSRFTQLLTDDSAQEKDESRLYIYICVCAAPQRFTPGFEFYPQTAFKFLVLLNFHHVFLCVCVQNVYCSVQFCLSAIYILSCRSFISEHSSRPPTVSHQPPL